MKVEDILLTEEKQEKIKQIESNSQLGPKGRRNRQKVVLGECRVCGKIPTKKVIIEDEDGAQIIERYCDKHFKARMKET